MARPVLLDLFCKAGGATKGYQRAGWYVVGVDIEPQPNYCGDEFVQADAMTFPLDGFAAVHASPPCHDHSALIAFSGPRDDTEWMLAATLDRLAAAGMPWVVENVDRAQFHASHYRVRLCGSSFGLAVRRHRWFASNVILMSLPCEHANQRRRGPIVGVYGNSGAHAGARGYKGTIVERREAMAIDWMTREELSQAIPPAYTEHLGRQLLAALDPA